MVSKQPPMSHRKPLMHAPPLPKPSFEPVGLMGSGERGGMGKGLKWAGGRGRERKAERCGIVYEEKPEDMRERGAGDWREGGREG